MNFFNLIIRRKTFICMLFLGGTLLGIVSWRNLSMEMMPNVEYPTLIVQVSARTQMNPDYFERQAVIPLEGAIGTLDGISSIESITRQNRATITIYYEQRVNVNYAFLKLEERVNGINLPEDYTVNISKVNTERLTNTFMRLQVRGSGGLERVRSIIDKYVVPDIEHIDGIAHVEVAGGLVRSVEIVLNEDAVEAGVITPSRIRTLITQGADTKTFVGRVYDRNTRYFVSLVADYADISDIENLVIDQRGPLYLKDVATVTFGTKEETSISRVNGMETATIQLVRDANTNVIDLSKVTRKAIERLNRDLSFHDAEIVIQTDTAREMEDNINLILQLAVIGGLLALAILWFFLRNARLVAIVLVSVPVSIFIAFNLFYTFDITLNSLTLVGIALAVGMLLDNSVVVLENIYRHISLKRDRDEAVTRGVSEVWRSILASTLTTITVFLPFVFSSNQLVRVIGKQVGISIISTLVISLLVALLLIPVLTHMLLKRPDKKNRTYTKVSHRSRAVQVFRLLLKSAVRFPARTIITACIIFVASVFICLGLNLDVPRELELTEFPLYLTMPQGTTLERTSEVVTELEEILYEIPERKDIISTIYPEEASLTIVLREDYQKVRRKSITDIKQDIQDKIEDFRYAEVTLSEPQTGTRFGTGSSGSDPMGSLQRMFGIGTQREQMLVKGGDLTLIRKVAEDIQYNLQDMESVTSVSISSTGNRPEIHLLFDHQMLNDTGVTLNSISSELSSFQGQVSTTANYRQGTDQYEIIIRNERLEQQKTFEDLTQLRITSGSGGTVPLSHVSRIVYATGRSEIRRVNQEKQLSVTYRFSNDVYESKPFLQTARDDVQEMISYLNIPAGIAVEIVEESTEAKEFEFLIAAAFILIFMILASVFESVAMPGIMMFTIPLATIGSLWALILTGNSILNANSMIGFLILLGVVVNNGILLIDYTRILRKRGFNRGRALITAGQARVRPILITAITTIVGMIPLAMGKTEYVSRIGAPFAITVIGGLAVGTLFTLIFIPTLYSALESSLEWFLNLDRRTRYLNYIGIAVTCLLIMNNSEGIFMTAGYMLLATVAAPSLTWFTTVSLRRARADIYEGESISINVRRLVKVYDDDTRFVREWKKGERVEKLLGSSGRIESWRDLHSYLWQLPVLGFLLYFVVFYLQNQQWIFLFSLPVYFICLYLWTPVSKLANSIGEKRGSKFILGIEAVGKQMLIWGTPAINLLLFHYKGFRLPVLIFITIVWYGLLGIYHAAKRLESGKVQPAMIEGFLGGPRRGFYRLIQIIPVIGAKKKPYKALDGVSLEIGSGMFGLLGPNGAGKSTLMRIICGIFNQNMGKISINGVDFREKREELQGLIGYLPQEFGTYENMTAREFLDYLAILKGIYDKHTRKERVESVLSSVHLMENADKKIGSFSGGMKQRMGIALTLLHLPRILVVDEPTAGLDPRERIRFRNLLVELSRERIVIFSTHIIEDIASSCNRTAVLNKGRLYYSGSPREMTHTAEGKVWQFLVEEKQLTEMRTSLRVVHHMRVGDKIRIRCLSSAIPHPEAIQVRPTLEDAYLWLLGEQTDTEGYADAEVS